VETQTTWIPEGDAPELSPCEHRENGVCLVDSGDCPVRFGGECYYPTSQR